MVPYGSIYAQIDLFGLISGSSVQGTDTDFPSLINRWTTAKKYRTLDEANEMIKNQKTETRQNNDTAQEFLRWCESGEYGVKHIPAPQDSNLTGVCKQRSYHYSSNELTHKTNHIDKQNKEQ